MKNEPDKRPDEYTKPCDGYNSNVCVAEGCYISRPDGIPDCVRLQMKNRSEGENDFPVESKNWSNFRSNFRSYFKSFMIAAVLVSACVYVGIGIHLLIIVWSAGNELELLVVATLIVTDIVHRIRSNWDA